MLALRLVLSLRLLPLKVALEDQLLRLLLVLSSLCLKARLELCILLVAGFL